MADRIITVTDPSIVTNDTLSGYNNYSDQDGQLGTTMTPTEATNGHTVALSDGVVHEVTTKPVGTTNGEFSAVVSNAVTVDLSAPVGDYTDGTFTGLANITKSGTNYISSSTAAASTGGYSTTNVLVGDFRYRAEMQVQLDNQKTHISVGETQVIPFYQNNFTLWSNNSVLTVNAGSGTAESPLDNPTDVTWGAGNYIVIERIETTFNFIMDVGGVETLVHTMTGSTADMYLHICCSVIDDWIQKPEYQLL